MIKEKQIWENIFDNERVVITKVYQDKNFGHQVVNYFKKGKEITGKPTYVFLKSYTHIYG